MPRFFFFIMAFLAPESKNTDTMKKLMSIVVLLAVSVALQAQKSVTEFLGIPVDGTKSEMIRKLKAKGFESTSYDKDVLEGEFNGRGVYVFVMTNNNEVYRIALSDKDNIDEANIKIRFNNLCSQFEDNPKYLKVDDQTIPEGEDISYEMSVNSKIYEATFYQVDTTEFVNNSAELVSKKYSAEQLANPSEEVKKDIETINYSVFYELCSNKVVWFRILENYGRYYIAMFYDNGYNKADGSDL